VLLGYQQMSIRCQQSAHVREAALKRKEKENTTEKQKHMTASKPVQNTSHNYIHTLKKKKPTGLKTITQGLGKYRTYHMLR